MMNANGALAFCFAYFVMMASAVSPVRRASELQESVYNKDEALGTRRRPHKERKKEGVRRDGLTKKERKAASLILSSKWSSKNQSVVVELIDELYDGVSPYRALETGTIPPHVDAGYPHSNLRRSVVEGVLKYTGDPRFWLEIGSFIGNSAITTAKIAKGNTTIICMDPFTGDVNMWAWNKGHKGPKGFNFQEMDADGTTRIYDTFLSNVKRAGFQGKVLPVRVSSLAGMRLLGRLHREGRLSEMPKIIYLDSAHEEGETLMELRQAYDLLPAGGVLFGDDWGWPAVRGDVLKFAAEKQLPPLRKEFITNFGNSVKAADAKSTNGAAGVALVSGQWLIPK